MASSSIKLYKLIILYFLNKSKQDITNAILSDFILKYGYTDYFSIQETLSSLTEDKLIREEQTPGTAYYYITESGRETLGFFSKQLPSDTKEQIKSYLKEHRIQIANDTSLRIDYKQLKPDEFLATCSARERGSTIYEVSLNVTTEEDAIAVCRRFKENSDEIYAYLVGKLTND